MGKFLFLDYSPIKKESRLCLADFHNPVRVTVVRSGLKNAKSLTNLQGKVIALVLEGELNLLTVVEIERKVGLIPSKLKRKQSLQEFLHSVGLEQDGTVAELRNSVAEYLENKKKNTTKTLENGQMPSTLKET